MIFNVDSNFSKNGNKIVAPSSLKNVRCEFSGTDNLLVIHEDARISDILFQFPSNHGLIVIGKGVRVRGRVRAGYKSKVYIGDWTTSTTSIQIFTAEHTKVVVGEDNMFAHNVMIRSEDGHGIFDVESGERVNKSRDVIIGAHVWIAENSIVLAGSCIGSGTTIGCLSLVKGFIPNNCVAVGSPAKVVKKNTVWERTNLAFSEPWIRDNSVHQNIKSTPYYFKTKDDRNILLGQSVMKMQELYE
ncbi:acyltransferase [Psychrobacter arenosus]|uniref:acyltransferase n=1 Tax=Psychrobacter arenosus TaxID=256326 RepID=UPI001917A5FB|nr:acyltransferase [Psychrobacter arenosus]